MKKSRKNRKQMRRKTKRRRRRRQGKRLGRKNQRGGSGCHEKYIPRGGMNDPGVINQTNGGYYKGLNWTSCFPDALDSTMVSDYFPAKGGGIQKGGFFFPSNLAELGNNIKEIMTNTYNRLNAQTDVISYNIMEQDKLMNSTH